MKYIRYYCHLQLLQLFMFCINVRIFFIDVQLLSSGFLQQLHALSERFYSYFLHRQYHMSFAGSDDPFKLWIPDLFSILEDSFSWAHRPIFAHAPVDSTILFPSHLLFSRVYIYKLLVLIYVFLSSSLKCQEILKRRRPFFYSDLFSLLSWYFGKKMV